MGAGVLIFALVVIFWPQKKTVVENKTIKTVPASVVVIPTQDKSPFVSDTGAMYISPSDEQYKEIQLIKSLRNNCPVKNDYFEINYDYGIDKFTVVLSKENMATFLQWKKDTGYNGISDQYWQIKTND